MTSKLTFDVVIIGSGVGGAAAALRLAPSGASIAIVERGGHLPKELENWDAQAVFVDRRYVSRDEKWSFDGAAPERPLAYYFVGGATKVFGGVLMRFRERDFEAIEYPDGISPAWPIQYRDLAIHYQSAEKQFGVHGQAGEDPWDPSIVPLPYGPIEHDPAIGTITRQLANRGLKPFHLPLALQRHVGGGCLRCGTCDGFPCMVDAKSDAEVALVRPALAYPNVTLLANTLVTRLELSKDGKTIGRVVATQNGSELALTAKVFVLAAGAINSAALLLKSAQGSFDRGLANSSGVVGRHYMAHNSSVIMGIGAKRTGTLFQKTFGINDFYFGDADYPYPMGNVQMIGKVQGPMLKARLPFLPGSMRQAIADRSVDWYAQSEDLPHPESRVTVDARGSIHLDRKVTNFESHRQLIKRTTGIMRSLGFPVVVTESLDARVTSHQCGTVRMGVDPGAAALDPFCRSYDHRNLFVTDGSFFPSSSGVNPSLTIAAQAFRAADHMMREDLGFGASIVKDVRP